MESSEICPEGGTWATLDDLSDYCYPDDDTDCSPWNANVQGFLQDLNGDYETATCAYMVTTSGYLKKGGTLNERHSDLPPLCVR